MDPTLNIDGEPLEADLSRNDARLLVQLCADKRVVEFGMGGSTLLLARIASELVSYETDEHWVELVRGTFASRNGNYCPVTLRHCGGPPPNNVPRCEVMFVDGVMRYRPAWLRAAIEHRLTRLVVIHDSRKERPLVLCKLLLEQPYARWIARVDYHYRDSNCLVVQLRRRPIRHTNWNTTETNRAPHLHRPDVPLGLHG